MSGGRPVQAVETLLDAGLDAVVRRQWAALHEAGLPSQHTHRGATNAPHLTLAVAEAPTLPSIAADAVATAVTDRVPSTLTLGGLVVFPGRRRVVLARAVVPSRALLALHAAVVDALEQADVAVLPHLHPDRWTPHVTLARALPPRDLGAAVATLDPHREDTGLLVRLRHWDAVARIATPLA